MTMPIYSERNATYGIENNEPRIQFFVLNITLFARGHAPVLTESVSPHIVEKYFSELKSILTKYNLNDKPEKINNFDK